ncbi:Usher syndrome type-1G protein [Sarotherodon galilaeus]
MLHSPTHCSLHGSALCHREEGAERGGALFSQTGLFSDEEEKHTELTGRWEVGHHITLCLMNPAVLFTIFIISFDTMMSLDVCAPAGHDVLLPCICSELQRLPQRFEVLWEDREGRILLDIINGNTDVRFQHQTFRGRVQSFPHLYIEGNFSVLLKSIQISDSNLYKCIIPQMDFKEVIEVTVSDKRVSKPETSLPEPSSGDIRTNLCFTSSMACHLLSIRTRCSQVEY